MPDRPPAPDADAPPPAGDAEAPAPRGFLGRLWDEMWADEVFDRAAALSYYLVFAMFPMLLFLTALLGMLPFTLMDRLMEYLDRLLPSDVVRRTLGEIARGASGGILSLGIVVAVWSASSGMSAVMVALNVAYDVVDRRSWWHRRLVSVGLTVGLSLFVPGALLLIVFGERLGLWLAVRHGLGPTFVAFWEVARWLVVGVMMLLAVVVVYRYGPAVRLPWRYVLPGTLFAVAAWVGMSIGLRFYVQRFADYNATYGSIGGVILLILWLYLSGVVLLVGGEINSELAGRRRRAAGAGAPGEVTSAQPRPA